jgi:hypothetical protein
MQISSSKKFDYGVNGFMEIVVIATVAASAAVQQLQLTS